MQILQQPDKTPSELPLPRFAHQVAYNPKTKTVYLHGGNAGGGGFVSDNTKADGDAVIADASNDQHKDAPKENKERRLDDFWRMQLKRFVVFPQYRSATFLIWMHIDLALRKSSDKRSS